MTALQLVQALITLLAVIVGGLVTLGANWWLKRLEIQAKSDALKVAFRGEIGALRGALRVDTQEARRVLGAGGHLDLTVTYPRTIFDKTAGQIGDIRDPTLVQALAAFYTVLDRLEAIHTIAAPDRESRFIASLASALYLAAMLDMRLTEQTKELTADNFTMRVTAEDRADQELAKEILARYGPREERRVVKEEGGGR